MTKPKKQPDMQEINERFGTFIWGMANRYHTGMWDPQDVYQQLLMMTYSAMCDGTLSMDESDGAVGLVKSFLISRAINIIRYEVRRQGAELTKSNKGGLWGLHKVRHQSKGIKSTLTDYTTRIGDEIKIEPTASDQPELIKFEIELIRELLFARLDHQTATFIFELAFPSEETIGIAIKEQRKARKDKNLRMNVHELKITTKHVAESLKQKLGRVVPPVTVSRIRGRAKEELYENGTRQLR